MIQQIWVTKIQIPQVQWRAIRLSQLLINIIIITTTKESLNYIKYILSFQRQIISFDCRPVL